MQRSARCMYPALLLCCVSTSGLSVVTSLNAQADSRIKSLFSQRARSFSQRAQDVVFVDAGSSGSKVFAFTPEKTGDKFLTECRDDVMKPGMLRGIASLAYGKAECEWQVGTSSDDLKALEAPEKYADVLLQLLATTYRHASGKADTSNVVESQSISILATAGMRLVSQALNDKVWSLVCGRSGSGFGFAKRGETCGTITGTTEAYYEFLANAVHGSSRTLTGTFSVGGASAQIAIPLKTEEDVAAFNQLRSQVMGELDCTGLQLADGTVAPVFNTKKEGGAQKECIDDYITFRPASQIIATQTIKENNVRIHDIQGIGLISFLGLEGRGTFVAGGVNQIASWAEKVGCAGNRSTFAECHEKMKDALAQDIMFKHVTTYFRDNAFNIHDFSYNTHPAVPEEAGVSHVHGHDQGWDLEAELKSKCDEDNSIRFGYKNSNTCMKALYTSLYVTSFFHRSDFVADDDGPDQVAHDRSKLHFDPQRDWAEGIQEEMSASISLLQRSVVDTIARKVKRHINGLLQVPLRRHSTNYMDGFKIHMSGLP